MVEMNKIWEPIFKDIEWYWPQLYTDIIDWYPSAQMEITFKISNGDKYVFDWISKKLIRVYSASGEDAELEEHEWREKFARVLDDKMRRLGVSRDVLSSRTGISRVTISKYLNGKATPSCYNLHKIAAALKCGVNELSRF